MPAPSPAIIQLLSVFAIAFTAPTWKNALVLLFGAIVAPGRRTVTAALRAVGLADEVRFEKYHRVLNRAQWQPLLLSQLLLGLIIQMCVPAEQPLMLVVDETLERRWGRKIKIRSIFRDPVRSSKQHMSYSSGIRWLCLAIVVPVPWGQRWWALPFLTVPLLSPKTSAQQGKRHRSSVARTAQLISQVRRWYPEREIAVIGDGGFAAVPLLQHCQRQRIRVTFIARSRLDMRLFDPPGPQPSSKRGPKPKKGERQPSLDARLNDANTAWTEDQIRWYGGEQRTVAWATGTSLWHRQGFDPVPIRWVLVRCPENSFPPTAFLCSEQSASPQQMIEWFIRRWHIEVTFEELRSHMGFGTQRQWSDKAIERTTPCLFGIFSLVVLIAITLHPKHLPLHTTAWYQKDEATFGDALAAVRSHLWRLDQLSYSANLADPVPIPAHLLRSLCQLALHPV